MSDIFDLGKSSMGEHYLSIRDSVIIPRGANIARILVASLTGALPSSRLETVASTLKLVIHIKMLVIFWMTFKFKNSIGAFFVPR